jgi:hypothetical protein
MVSQLSLGTRLVSDYPETGKMQKIRPELKSFLALFTTNTRYPRHQIEVYRNKRRCAFRFACTYKRSELLAEYVLDKTRGFSPHLGSNRLKPDSHHLLEGDDAGGCAAGVFLEFVFFGFNAISANSR